LPGIEDLRKDIKPLGNRGPEKKSAEGLTKKKGDSTLKTELARYRTALPGN